jgi:hypothetical protein
MFPALARLSPANDEPQDENHKNDHQHDPKDAADCKYDCQGHSAFPSPIVWVPPARSERAQTGGPKKNGRGGSLPAVLLLLR